MATFDPTCLEDRPPGTGGHPVSKPVVLGPFPGVGLVSPLHSLVLCARGRFAARLVCRGAVRTGARPECLASHARRVPAYPPGRMSRNRTLGAAIPVPAQWSAGAQFHEEFSRVDAARDPRSHPTKPFATRGCSRYSLRSFGTSSTRQAGVPFPAISTAPNALVSDYRVLLPRGHQTSGRRWTADNFPDNPHVWICLWTILAAGRRRPW